ncbi:MAG: biotin/lipoyl-binding protein, partial [Proteobacteria bacterium]|nr:biotin/lipoyl-binding protein [Pseudomonadota bacterium]
MTRSRRRARPGILVAAGLLVLAGCGGKPAPGPSAAAPALASIVVQPERTPLERPVDGVIEAVNQATVSAQTSGRVAAILVDVNDFVPAGAVIMRLRSTEQRAGLQQAEAALVEARARAAEAQTNY